MKFYFEEFFSLLKHMFVFVDIFLLCCADESVLLTCPSNSIDYMNNRVDHYLIHNYYDSNFFLIK